jgi:micrococcal nuclease
MARRAHWPRSQRAIVAALVLAFAALAAALGAYTARGTASATAALEGAVVRIVDGDTIHVQIGDRLEKVRYIGVNTPEVHHPRKGLERGGRDAVRVNRDLVSGRTVRLELDVQERDRYGRLLAYVWVGDVMVNEELVRLGYAQVMTVPPNVRYQQRFLTREREARESGRGLWG